MRILGLDIGSKRIGVAVSDELGFTAQGLETLTCSDPNVAVRLVGDLVLRYGVDEIVIGMPYDMNGTEGPQAKKVRGFMERLAMEVHVPLREWDERLSTVAAERALLEANLSRSKRRKIVDKVAAVLILQAYLDMRRHGDQSNG
ncbi:MAG: Holliday junction resolvase RuvX [Deltaproteobacteria bacterium]|nr:Holliday junction resolvase RuvX [Deltaproteobacteria bacterium]